MVLDDHMDVLERTLADPIQKNG